jgi:hypothetical protein
MTKIVWAVLLVSLTTSLSWAAPWDGRRAPPEHQQRGPQPGQAPPGQAPQPDRRMQRDDRRDGALSEEERRGLHRDLDRANRELYRRR